MRKSWFLSVNEIFENQKEFKLKMDAEDSVEHIHSPVLELTIDELIELKK